MDHSDGDKSVKKRAPGRTPEARENQLISLAYDVAESRMRDGTASSQLVCTFLNLATTKARLEQDLLREKVGLAKAQTEATKSQKNIEEMFKAATEAMKNYRPSDSDEEEFDD